MNTTTKAKRFSYSLKRLPRALKTRKSFALDVFVKGSYLVTTDRGLIHVQGRLGRFLTTWTGYGIAVLGNKIALVDELIPYRSRVVVLDRKQLLSGAFLWPYAAACLPSIFEQRYVYTNGRIHQLMPSPNGKILCCATEINAIVEIDHESGDAEYTYPFSDQFGAPIQSGDHNHINSVFADEDGVYFVAYRAGLDSLIGHIDRYGGIVGWFINPRGFHDIYRTDSGFFTCDTFGRDERGAIISETGPVMPDFMERHACAPRGIGSSGDEWIFGYSHKGPRSKRFKGKGGLIIWDGETEPKRVIIPASQVYQIAQSDGQPISLQRSGLRVSLETSFGAPTELGSGN